MNKVARVMNKVARVMNKVVRWISWKVSRLLKKLTGIT